MHGTNTKQITFTQPEVAKFGSAKAHGILEDDPKYGREVTSRRTDGLEHFRGRGLLLLQFAQFAIALLKLLVEGRLLRTVERLALRTTLGRRRPF